MNFIRNFINDEQGQDLVEYSLLLVLIAAAAMFALTAIGQSVTQLFSKLNGTITDASSRVS